MLADLKLAVIAESDLTGRRRTHRQARRRKRDTQRFFEDLREGSFVVHHQHGVARFGGMVTRAIGGNERDYLLLEYRGGDKLYVPSDQIESVRHYTGGDNPTLSKMGGSDWNQTKAKVRSAVQEIAQELVVLYQKRVTSLGHSFAPDTPWQGEFEASFPFQETSDQLNAIIDVKNDMELESPMDRLVVGDVGFGKTEIGMRAAFKAIQDGKQVAVLVPTTLLAQQHVTTFTERMAPYPIRVEVLSRFLTAKQAKAVTDGLKDGEVDLVVGTHRLLGEGIEFKNLGLLIVDEEQRFGVSHKEQIKELRHDIDVLTLTATPIRARWRCRSPASATCRCSTHRRRTVSRSLPMSVSTRNERSPRRSVVNCFEKGRSSSCTTACATSTMSPNGSGTSYPRRGWRSLTGRWMRARSNGRG